MKNNNGQMTLWVVIAIVLAIIILVFLELNKNVLPSSSNNNNDFVSSIKKCASDPAQEVIQKMLDQGGYINNTNYKVLDGKNISYICQNLGYYKTCINQHPLIIDDELKQIRDYISPIVDNCFNNLKADLEKQNYQVNMSNMSIDTSFGPNKLYIDINRKIDCHSLFQTAEFFKVLFEFIVYLFVFQYGLISVTILRLIRYNE